MGLLLDASLSALSVPSKPLLAECGVVIDSCDGWIGGEDRELLQSSTIRLDGEFTAYQLLAVVLLMRSKAF